MILAGGTCLDIATRLGIPPPASFAVAAICARYPTVEEKARAFEQYLRSL